MKSISLKVNDPVFQEMEKILENVQVSRNKYINEAIEYYNALQDRLLLEKQLQQESATVSEDSMAVLHEFEDKQLGEVWQKYKVKDNLT